MECFRHPDRNVYKVCTRCDRWQCDECVRSIKAGWDVLETCADPACGGVVRVGAEPARTAGEDVKDLVGRVASREGLITAASLALPLVLVRVPIVNLLSTLWRLMYLGGAAGFYFVLIDHVGRDRKGLPTVADTFDDISSLKTMIWRGYACLFVTALPLLLYRLSLWHQPAHTSLLTTRPLAVLGLLALGLTYAPAAIIAVVRTNRTMGAFWPPLWIQIMTRSPQAYARLVGLFLASLLAWWLAELLAMFCLAPIPLFGAGLVGTLSNLVLFAQAAVVGGYIRDNASAFGYD